MAAIRVHWCPFVVQRLRQATRSEFPLRLAVENFRPAARRIKFPPMNTSILTALVAIVALPLGAADFQIERSTVLTSAGDYYWSQSRPAVIPGNPLRVVVTTQEI